LHAIIIIIIEVNAGRIIYCIALIVEVQLCSLKPRKRMQKRFQACTIKKIVALDDREMNP
jgi:hypothetical protein